MKPTRPPTIDQRQAVGEYARRIELRVDDHLSALIDIAPFIAGSHCRAIFIEAAGLFELRVDDNLSGLIDEPVAAPDTDQCEAIGKPKGVLELRRDRPYCRSYR